jgi:hypothetical protein
MRKIHQRIYKAFGQEAADEVAAYMDMLISEGSEVISTSNHDARDKFLARPFTKLISLVCDKKALQTPLADTTSTRIRLQDTYPYASCGTPKKPTVKLLKGVTKWSNTPKPPDDSVDTKYKFGSTWYTHEKLRQQTNPAHSGSYAINNVLGFEATYIGGINDVDPPDSKRVNLMTICRILQIHMKDDEGYIPNIPGHCNLCKKRFGTKLKVKDMGYALTLLYKTFALNQNDEDLVKFLTAPLTYNYNGNTPAKDAVTRLVTTLSKTDGHPSTCPALPPALSDDQLNLSNFNVNADNQVVYTRTEGSTSTNRVSVYCDGKGTVGFQVLEAAIDKAQWSGLGFRSEYRIFPIHRLHSKKLHTDSDFVYWLKRIAQDVLFLGLVIDNGSHYTAIAARRSDLLKACTTGGSKFVYIDSTATPKSTSAFQCGGTNLLALIRSLDIRMQGVLAIFSKT